MTNLQDLLRTADPLVDEPALEDGEVQRVRRRVVAEAGSHQPVWRPRPVAVAAAIVATFALGILVGQRLTREPETRARIAMPTNIRGPIATPQPALESGRRQVQFATPGGTRIIWVIDPDFDW
jgi:hypothetical protein